MTQPAPGRILALGAFTIAMLDGLYAVGVSSFRGVDPARVFQGVAAGLLGRASLQGGAVTAALGVAIHVGVATAVMLTFYAAALRWRGLLHRPFLSGSLYGVVVYLVMNLVVIPLSAIGPRSIPPIMIAGGLSIHVLGVGLPAAFFARAAIAASVGRHLARESGAMESRRTGPPSPSVLR